MNNQTQYFILLALNFTVALIGFANSGLNLRRKGGSVNYVWLLIGLINAMPIPFDVYMLFHS